MTNVCDDEGQTFDTIVLNKYIWYVYVNLNQAKDYLIDFSFEIIYCFSLCIILL